MGRGNEKSNGQLDLEVGRTGVIQAKREFSTLPRFLLPRGDTKQRKGLDFHLDEVRNLPGQVAIHRGTSSLEVEDPAEKSSIISGILVLTRTVSPLSDGQKQGSEVPVHPS